jgi:hypothetical protein
MPFWQVDFIFNMPFRQTVYNQVVKDKSSYNAKKNKTQDNFCKISDNTHFKLQLKPDDTHFIRENTGQSK